MKSIQKWITFILLITIATACSRSRDGGRTSSTTPRNAVLVMGDDSAPRPMTKAEARQHMAKYPTVVISRDPDCESSTLPADGTIALSPEQGFEPGSIRTLAARLEDENEQANPVLIVPNDEYAPEALEGTPSEFQPGDKESLTHILPLNASHYAHLLMKTGDRFKGASFFLLETGETSNDIVPEARESTEKKDPIVVFDTSKGPRWVTLIRQNEYFWSAWVDAEIAIRYQNQELVSMFESIGLEPQFKLPEPRLADYQKIGIFPETGHIQLPE